MTTTVDATRDARIRDAVRAACSWNADGWAFTWEIARHFGTRPNMMGSRLAGAERRGLVEKRVHPDGCAWRLAR